MIQDIGPHVYSNVYAPTAPAGDSVILAYEGRQVLLKKEGDVFSYPLFSDVPGAQAQAEEYQYLFAIDGQRFYLAKAGFKADGFSYVSISYLRSARPRYLAFAGITGLSLAGWYRNHRFCGQCGRPMVHSETERMVHCDTCHTMIYPQICPAVIVAVRNGNRLLISKYAGREYKRFALLAGFAEIGETIEDTVRREVMEEVGIRVKNLQFYKSQPWSFSDSLLLGFFCDVDGSEELHVDHSELAIAQWVQREDLPDDTEKTSLTMEMMTLFKQGKA